MISAAVLEHSGGPLVIRNLVSGPLLSGQVKVKMAFSGVCHSQIMEVAGLRGEDRWLPHLLGHEGTGIVDSVGPDVTKVAPGDKVVLGWIRGEGIEAEPAKYICSDNGVIVNAGRVTTFANINIVSESRVVKVANDFDLRLGVLYGCALPTGGGMVINQSEVTEQSTVVVLGLGGIGLSAILTLLAKGLTNIIAIDKNPEKLELVKTWGVPIALDASLETLTSDIISLTKGGCDLCIESAGTTESIELGFKLVRFGGGRILFASHPPYGDQIRLDPHHLIRGKRIEGSWGGEFKPDSDIAKLDCILQNHKSLLGDFYSKEYRLDEINDALADLKKGKARRPLIVF
ncbi:zinc-binding dehydrogenase [Litorivicinus sp.]|nr:zinc-binding dehydrogenase [Litorivicinus sp.]